MRALLLLTFAFSVPGCQTPEADVAASFIDEAAGPPTPPTFDLDVGPACPGQILEARITGGQPLAPASVVVGSAVGAGRCRGNTCMSITGPYRVLAETTLDEAGEAVLWIDLDPALAAGRPGALQVVSRGTTDVSDAVAMVTLDPASAQCAPVAVTCDVGPASATFFDDLYVSHRSTDPTRPPMRPLVQWQTWMQYAWFDYQGETDAVLQSCETRNIPCWLLNCARGSRIRAACSYPPGSGLSTHYSQEIVLENSPPSVDGCAINPAAPTDADALTTTALGADPDADATRVQLAWMVNGVQVSTAPTLSAAATAPGDRVELVCNAWDGLARTSVTSSSVVIAPVP